jgi:tryptophan synthase alpha subunit
MPKISHKRALMELDGVIIGSRIIKFIEDNLDDTDAMKKQLKGYIQEVVKEIARS